ncbi:PQQ-dependent sugar dehydrogenase [Coralliovum pocilloporae]|uniref:PQQ-dependent sugar dehydrogenase n=1 Tax=Coralliovum pocilloporae TaxID=3066369 RepID=UPI003306B289
MIARYAAVTALALSTSVLSTLFTALPARAAGVEIKTEDYTLIADKIADNLDHPWGLAFLPDQSMLVTERRGRLRHVKNGVVSAPLKGLPRIADGGQGGLLDVAVAPDFNQTRHIYFTFSEPSKDRRSFGTALGRARLNLSPTPHLTEATVLFSQNRKTRTRRHFGSRIVFAPDGTLFLTIGDRGDRPRAQDPRDHAGSVIRLNRDGSVPKDNPFADGRDGAPEIWSIGHRNPQGATWHKGENALWTVEHGARGGDEINRPRKGLNYGWPVISYGRHYSGLPIGEGKRKSGLEQPLYYWDPSIAPSGLAYYDGTAFKKWQGNILVGALKDRMLVRLKLNGSRVVHEERILKRRFGRIRDVRQGPDGLVYLLIDDDDGAIIRLSPKR